MPMGSQIVGPPDVGPEPSQLGAIVAQAMGGVPPDQLGVAPPDPFGDDAALLKLFEGFRKESFDNRAPYERAWLRNLLYVLGRQWIFFDVDRGQWRDKRLAKWIPRPVTNKMSETVDSVMSVFQSVQLAVTCRPEGNDPADVTTAETANKLAPAIHYEHNMNTVQAEGDFWLIATGNVFYHVWWDKRSGKDPVTVPYEQCATCGETYPPDQVIANNNLCPNCGQAIFKPALDPVTGQPKVQSFVAGHGCTDACSPFEIAFPLSYTRFQDLPGLIRKRWRARSWAEKNLPPDVLSRIQWEKMTTDRSLQMLRGLAVQNDLVNSPLGTLAANSQEAVEGFTEYELWLKPTQDYPDGLFLRVVGEGEGSAFVLRLPDQSTPGPLPYKTAQGEPLFPWTHTPYTKFGGRIWGRAALDTIIQKQDQLNQTDSLIQLIVQRVANPVWLEPKGTEVKKFTGEPGLVVKYNPLALGGTAAKPERIEGANVPSSLFNLRQQILDDIENLAGTYDIIKGAKPSGVEAFSALQLLVERSQSRYGTVLASRGETYRQWFELAIELERQYGPQQRTWAVLGPNQSWTYQQFQNADLQGGVSIMVEDGSQTPKTSLGKRAAIEQLVQLRVINTQNPDTAYQILQTFGQTDLWPGLDYDVKSALQEQDDFERWAATVQFIPVQQPMTDPTTGQPALDPRTGQPAMQMGMQPSSMPPVGRKPWHNDAVHLAEHKKWANGDTVRQLLQQKPQLEQWIAWMLQEHEYYLQLQQAQAAAMQGGGDGEPGGGGRALRNSNQESGNPADVPRGQNERPNEGGGGQGPA